MAGLGLSRLVLEKVRQMESIWCITLLVVCPLNSRQSRVSVGRLG